jgi:hypothetical protein
MAAVRAPSNARAGTAMNHFHDGSRNQDAFAMIISSVSGREMRDDPEKKILRRGVIPLPVRHNPVVRPERE